MSWLLSALWILHDVHQTSMDRRLLLNTHCSFLDSTAPHPFSYMCVRKGSTCFATGRALETERVVTMRRHASAIYAHRLLGVVEGRLFSTPSWEERSGLREATALWNRDLLSTGSPSILAGMLLLGLLRLGLSLAAYPDSSSASRSLLLADSCLGLRGSKQFTSSDMGDMLCGLSNPCLSFPAQGSNYMERCSRNEV